MKTLMALLLEQVAARVEREVKHTLEPVPGYLRQLAYGTAILTLSTLGWSGAVIFLGLAAFFTLAHLSVFAFAALWTATIYTLFGLITIAIGSLMVRKPR